MNEGPNIALLGSLIGDPARANMLTALLSGKALTASELASVAGVTLQTTSSHLAKMEAGGLISRRRQGRHHYFSLAGEDVASVLEQIAGLAARQGHQATRTGPRDPALRQARVCYNHLAGERGVQLFDSLLARQFVAGDGEQLHVTAAGTQFLAGFGIALADISKPRRPLCKSCLDWSARRSHMAGTLGTALLGRLFALKWARRQPDSRIVTFTRTGDQRFTETFPV
ncbi:MAG: winged helix-turn-helix transcriptional regulator [Rhodospirillales bacterium]|nr:winged helix-turn-helix transcriptional regulator [Rhodospirillales bacterium]